GLAPRRRRAQRVEVGALDQHVLGLVRAGSSLSPENAPEAQHALGIGDDAHRTIDAVRLPIEAFELLALAAEAGRHRTRELVRIVDAQRPAAVAGDVVSHIDARVDRPPPRPPEAALQPGRRPALAAAP